MIQKITIQQSYEKTSSLHYLDFISIGLSCHALCLLNDIGVLKKLLSNMTLGIKKKSQCNFPLLKAALLTLLDTNIITEENGQYSLTEMGKEFASNIDSFKMIFHGYGKLLSKQYEIFNQTNLAIESDVNFQPIMEASEKFECTNIDPVLIHAFKELNITGSICDLGCGSGSKLIRICSELKCPGLGIEQNIFDGDKHKISKINELNIDFFQGDIFNLLGVWEDIEVALCSFVYHDIHEKNRSISFLKSLDYHFPRLKYVVILDLVSASLACPSIYPGFDYAHGLLGISPPTYEDMKSNFEQAGLRLEKEYPIPNAPNMFLWTLTKIK